MLIVKDERVVKVWHHRDPLFSHRPVQQVDHQEEIAGHESQAGGDRRFEFIRNFSNFGFAKQEVGEGGVLSKQKSDF